MKNTISILGCGWLGLALGKSFSEKGYLVKGSTTSNSKIKELKNNEILPFLIDISKNINDYSIFLNTEILIIAIPSKDIIGFKNLILEIEKSKVNKVLFVSSTSVYPYSNSIITEETKTNSSPLSKIELLFSESKKFKTTIIRFGGLIGYNRNPGYFFKNEKPIINPLGFVNLIHRDDCIKIIQEIIEKDIWSTILNACSDSHPTRKEFYTKEFKKVGRNLPKFEEDSTNNYKIIKSEKLKSLLNYCFKYSDLMKY